VTAAAARERWITAADNLRLFFRDFGDEDGGATPLLCIPGLTRNSHDFLDIGKRLAPARRVVCPDLRGRGRSQYARDWRSYDAGIYIDDLRHLLAALGIGKVVIVGTSMGGLLGLAMAAAIPTQIAGLIINDVGPDITPSGASRILEYIGRDRPQPDWAAAVQHLREMFPMLSLKTDEDWLAFARGTFREDPDGYLHFDWDVTLARPVVSPPEPLPDLWRFWRAAGNIPTLAIRGGASDILSETTFARMKAEMPSLRQLTLPDIGHAPTLDEPACREAIDEFLRQV
jgi:pimeloyl-ACP methyl ester carboxylesterase